MPTNVRNFFWLNVLSLALGALNSFLMAAKTQAMVAAAGLSPNALIATQVCVMLVFLLLLWLIAFKRQNWARWVWVGLFVLGLPGYIGLLKNFAGFSPSLGLSLAQLVLQVAGLYFVFTGNAVDWFKREPAAA